MFSDYRTTFGSLKWDLSGTKLIVQTPDPWPHHYKIFDFTTGDTIDVPTPTGEDSDEACWSPDGDKIVFDVGNDDSNNRLYIYTLTDSSYVLIGDFPAKRPSWGRQQW